MSLKSALPRLASSIRYLHTSSRCSAPKSASSSTIPSVSDLFNRGTRGSEADNRAIDLLGSINNRRSNRQEAEAEDRVKFTPSRVSFLGFLMDWLPSIFSLVSLTVLLWDLSWVSFLWRALRSIPNLIITFLDLSHLVYRTLIFITPKDPQWYDQPTNSHVDDPTLPPYSPPSSTSTTQLSPSSTPRPDRDTLPSIWPFLSNQNLTLGSHIQPPILLRHGQWGRANTTTIRNGSNEEESEIGREDG